MSERLPARGGGLKSETDRRSSLNLGTHSTTSRHLSTPLDNSGGLWRTLKKPPKMNVEDAEQAYRRSRGLCRECRASPGSAQARRAPAGRHHPVPPASRSAPPADLPGPRGPVSATRSSGLVSQSVSTTWSKSAPPGPVRAAPHSPIRSVQPSHHHTPQAPHPHTLKHHTDLELQLHTVQEPPPLWLPHQTAGATKRAWVGPTELCGARWSSERVGAHGYQCEASSTPQPGA